MRERIGNSKCIGFARIDYKETCTKIIKELNGQPFPGKNNINKHNKNNVKLLKP
jgi:hypothetical protein